MPAPTWIDAIQQCSNILASCDEVVEYFEGSDDATGVSDRAIEFAESVGSKVESIQSWVKRNQEVTDAQREALDNMQAAVERWRRD